MAYSLPARLDDDGVWVVSILRLGHENGDDLDVGAFLPPSPGENLNAVLVEGLADNG
jgi:hypothetical protein